MSAGNVSERVQIIRARLTEKMKETDIGPSQLSTRAGLNSTAVHAIMTGKSASPGICTIEALANALGCSFLDLVLSDAERGPRFTSDNGAHTSTLRFFSAADGWTEERRRAHDAEMKRAKNAAGEEEFIPPAPEVEIDVREELEVIELASARIRNFFTRHNNMKG